MIQINLTLLVQLLHLFITYQVLSRFLLAPIIERVLARKKEEKLVRDEIILKQKDVSNFLVEKTTQLAQFQKDSVRDYPFAPAKSKSHHVDLKGEKSPEITEAEYADLKKTVTQRLYHADDA